jgi:hypothetical protein
MATPLPGDESLGVSTGLWAKSNKSIIDSHVFARFRLGKSRPSEWPARHWGSNST